MLRQICEIEEECFSTSWDYTQFIKALESNTMLIFALLENIAVSTNTTNLIKNRVCSYLVLQCIPSVKNLEEGEIEVINIATTNEFRRKGHAQRLLEYAIEYAKEQKVDKIFLDVRESNYSALALYNKLLFKEVGRRKKYYTTKLGKEDAILMTYFIE